MSTSTNLTQVPDAKVYTPPPSLVPYLTADKFSNLVVGPVGCLAGDTLVITEDGATPIASITRSTRVLSWDELSNRYVLAQASVAIPKGTDYLYRVRTPQGEFDAAGSHLLLCADNVYRRVQDLQAGDAVKSCSSDLAQTMQGACPLAWLSDVPHLTRTGEGCLGGYGVLDRLHGLLALSVQAGVLTFAPLHSDARTYNQPCALPEISRFGALEVELLIRTHLALSDALTGTDGCVPHVAPLQADVAYHNASCTYAHCERKHQESQLSGSKTEFRQQAQVFGGTVLGSSYGSDLQVSCESPSLTTTDRTIISVTRLDRKEIYWDIQVSGTHNYVTVDGAIHHNSTKTTASIMKIAYEAKRVAPCPDGIRRSRTAVIRNTNQMLTDAFLPDFFKWYPDGQAGHFERTNRKFILRFDDVECEILFRGLDDPNDVRRLLSLQLSFGVMDEFREIHPDIYDALTGRLGRYPDKSMNGVGCCDDEGKQIHKVWGATNPPDADTHWEELLSDPPENLHVTIQPSGLSPDADWVQYLPDGYYDNLAQGKSDDWIDVYIHGKFGRSLSGKPVFPGFMREFHVAKQTLKPLVSLEHPLIIGMDFGLTPACTINQTDLRGRFLTFAELTSENMGITRFIREKLKPLLAQRFAGHPVIIIGDPAGAQRAQTDERSVFDVIKAEGFKVIPAKTNSIVARIGAVEGLLAGQVDGGARHLIDPSCTNLIKGLAGGYRYKVKKTGDMEDKPEKNSYSHLSDGHQYACLHVDSVFGSLVAGARSRVVKKISTGGWT